MKSHRVWVFLACCSLLVISGTSASELAIDSLDPAPVAIIPGPSEESLFVAFARAHTVGEFCLKSKRFVRYFKLPSAPSGLALSAKLEKLIVTCSGPESQLHLIDLSSGGFSAPIAAGHTAVAPLLSPSGKRVYVCSRFDHAVRELDLESGSEIACIPVLREPVSAALTPDGRLLFVANHLHSGPSDTNVVAAKVTVIDTAARQVQRQIELPNGSTLLRDICVSPDGKHVALVHNLARFHLPTTHVTWGWMNNAALTLIDTETLQRVNTVLLDDLTRGAANPWACTWSSDGRHIFVTHAGTHELTIIDAPGLLSKLATLPERLESPLTTTEYFPPAKIRSDVPNDFRFLRGLKTRVQLLGRGPRSMALVRDVPVIAQFFSGSLERVPLESMPAAPELIWRPESVLMSAERRGEDWFNDARLCKESWQSCASCHSDDARVDGLNWDLHNDGVGNPKNVRSLLHSFERSPVMSMGVRADASAAIRAGIKYILFTNLPPEFAADMDVYIKSLNPVPSPRLVKGRLSPAAERGKRVFEDSKTRCAACHRGPLFTDYKQHAVGTGKFDRPGDRFYTPSLIELWRTAPYLHDGSAATLRDVITAGRSHSLRGSTAHLSAADLDDLLAYLESL